MTSTGRVARLTALALATGTLVAAGAGTAGATSTQKTDYTASGGGSVIALTINMPSQLNPVLDAAGLPHALTQKLVLTGGAIRTADVKAIATSTLGADGNVVALSGLLDKSVTAEYGKPAPAPFTVLPAELTNALAGYGIHVRALELNSSAANPAVDGELSHSLSTVADLTVDGNGAVTALLQAVTAQVQAILATALGTATASQLQSLGPVSGGLQTVTNLVPNLLNSVTDTLDAATQGTTTPLTDAEKAAVQTVITQLNNLPNLLTSTVAAQSADTSLLKVGLIESEQKVTRAAGVVTSTSTNKLVGVSALGGLVTVNGLTSAATAALGNGTHSATADPGQNAILDADLAHLLQIKLGSDLGVTVSGLPAQLQPVVQGALDQISALLSGVLGATLIQTKAEPTVNTADHVSSSVTAAHLTINPTLPGLNTPLFDKPILDIQFVPATADVKANAVVPPTVTNPAAAHSTPVFAPTGANFALTAPIAIGLMGLAVVARRRRLAHLGE